MLTIFGELAANYNPETALMIGLVFEPLPRFRRLLLSYRLVGILQNIATENEQDYETIVGLFFADVTERHTSWIAKERKSDILEVPCRLPFSEEEKTIRIVRSIRPQTAIPASVTLILQEDK